MTSIDVLHPGAGETRANLVDHVDVRLEVYLSGSTLKIAELNALRQGDVIALDDPLNANVEVRINGIVIAEGELVAVGDRFAVKIVSLAP